MSWKIWINNLPVVENSWWSSIRCAKLFSLIITFLGKKNEERHFIYNLNLFTLDSQTKYIFTLSRKTLYESCAFTEVKQIPSLPAWQAKWIAFFVLQDTAYFPSLKVPYVFLWFCLISVSVMDIENWMPYARNNHGKAECRGYVMSLFIQQKPAYLPFCLYCYTDKSDCLDYRSRSILWLS